VWNDLRGQNMLRALSVDLTNESFTERILPYESTGYLGGRGLAVSLFSVLVSADTIPESPENKVIFSCGTLINSRIPMSGRSNATSISPLTNTIFSSNVGGMFGKNLKATGYDVMIIGGKAKKPVYLTLGKTLDFHDASELWHRDVFETTDALIKEHDVKEGRIACIGPAGENRNYHANIMVQRHRAFGRGGLGAVLGHKKMKAMVFQGKKIGEDVRFSKLSKRLRQKIKKIDNKLKTQGTSGVVKTANRNEAMPTMYFKLSRFAYAKQINGDAMEARKERSATCYSCPVACKMITRSDRYDITTDGPEYETIVFQGSNLGISDLDVIIKSSHMCDRFGLDTISSGNIIGAFIEAVENEKLRYRISWGDEKKIHELLEKIALNKGVGKKLQKGTDAFCKKHKIESLTVKGLDLPGHDGRALHGMALGYATSNRGADHLYSSTYKDEYDHQRRREIEGKAKLVIKNENKNAMLDTLGLCKFSTSFYKDADYLDIMYVLLGRRIKMDEFLAMGAHIVNMERVYNNMRGFDSKDDVLPRRVSVPHFKKELQEYYNLRGWSKDGKVE
jgi:aldehyde:ferredoxin oxidoreductase